MYSIMPFICLGIIISVLILFCIVLYLIEHDKL